MISDVFTERRTLCSSFMYTLGPTEMELDSCFLPQMSKYLSLGARPPFGVLQINPCFSLPRRRSLTPVNTVCEAAPRSLSLSPHRTQRITESEFRVSLQPDWQIDNWIFFFRPNMTQLQSQYTGGVQNKDFGASF